MFDVLAIQGENAERLIPKSPKDKLARFFFSPGKEIPRPTRQEVGERSRARIKRLFKRAVVLT